MTSCTLFYFMLMTLGKAWIHLFTSTSPSCGQIVRLSGLFSFHIITSLNLKIWLRSAIMLIQTSFNIYLPTFLHQQDVTQKYTLHLYFLFKMKIKMTLQFKRKYIIVMIKYTCLTVKTFFPHQSPRHNIMLYRTITNMKWLWTSLDAPYLWHKATDMMYFSFWGYFTWCFKCFYMSE